MTTTATYAIPITEFTALNGAPFNAQILTQELAGAGLSVPVQSVTSTVGGTLVLVAFDGRPTEADADALDTVVASHTGGAFSSGIQQAQSYDDLWGAGALETTSADWVTVLDHDTGYLAPGTYLAQWTAEMKVSPEAPDEDVELRAVLIDWQGIPEVELSLSASDSDRWHDWTNGTNLPVLAGQKIHLRFQARSVGGNSTASVRRMRLRIGLA